MTAEQIQDVHFFLTNDELVAAIAWTFDTLHTAALGVECRLVLQDHLKALLAFQRTRAEMVSLEARRNEL